MVLLQVASGSKRYASGDRWRCVLENIDLLIDAGERLAIVGASGSGKSTLLHMLGGLDAPDAGVVRFDGRDLYAGNEAVLAQYRNQDAGFVFQFYHLLPEFTAVENVILPGIIGGQAKRHLIDRGMAVLEELGLAEQAMQFPNTLSGGEQQRVAVARALFNDPRVILADEPTGNLDAERGEQVLQQLLRACTARNTALVMVTHDHSIGKYMDRILTLHDGVLHES